eukprot:7446277-Pyramimonas_sp.AAC.1
MLKISFANFHGPTIDRAYQEETEQLQSVKIFWRSKKTKGCSHPLTPPPTPLALPTGWHERNSSNTFFHD